MADSIWARNDGLYLGYVCKEIEGVPPPLDRKMLLPYVGDRHVITVGPNGSGKSRRLLLVNLERLLDWSILVIDPKGELAAMTAKHREQGGRRVVVLNPFNALGLGSHGFNPVAALDPESDDFPDDALGLAEALIRVEGREPHWSQSAQDLIAALIMYSRLTAADGGSLEHVRTELGKPNEEFGDVVAKMMETGVAKKWPELKTKAAHFADISPENRELNSIVSTALTQTRWLDSRPVKADLGKGAFDFRTMKDHPTTVYLILPAGRLVTHSTWLRLIITSVMQPLMKDTRKASIPVLFMLDEFAQLGHLPIIENTMAMMRGYGLKLWTVLQDLAQARHVYGDRWESFVGNAGVLQSFAPQDTVTAEYLSKRTGEGPLPEVSHSVTRIPGTPTPANETITTSSRDKPGILPHQLRKMDDGFSVLFSHVTKGTVRTYMPDPSDLPHMREICPRDPSA